MNVSVFGLGYVGCVSLGCLAQDGHSVIGIDVSAEKVDLINHGKPTIIEAKIGRMIADAFRNNKIYATTDHKKAVHETDVSIVCVGTPSSEAGHLNLEFVHKVAAQIGAALKDKDDFHTVVIRSTVLPGTNHRVGEIIEEESGRRRNHDFGVVSNPEFMREGSAVDDYYNPGIIVLGSDCERSLDIVREVYKSIDAPIEVTSIGVAEMIKYVTNCFLATKVSFANEMHQMCEKLDIDYDKVVEYATKDKRLGTSHWAVPGHDGHLGFGGSCFCKDINALMSLGKKLKVKTTVMDAAWKKNLEVRPERDWENLKGRAVSDD